MGTRWLIHKQLFVMCFGQRVLQVINLNSFVVEELVNGGCNNAITNKNRPGLLRGAVFYKSFNFYLFTGTSAFFAGVSALPKGLFFAKSTNIGAATKIDE